MSIQPGSLYRLPDYAADARERKRDRNVQALEYRRAHGTTEIAPVTALEETEATREAVLRAKYDAALDCVAALLEQGVPLERALQEAAQRWQTRPAHLRRLVDMVGVPPAPEPEPPRAPEPPAHTRARPCEKGHIIPAGRTYCPYCRSERDARRYQRMIAAQTERALGTYRRLSPDERQALVERAAALIEAGGDVRSVFARVAAEYGLGSSTVRRNYYEWRAAQGRP